MKYLPCLGFGQNTLPHRFFMTTHRDRFLVSLSQERTECTVYSPWAHS